MRNRTTHHHRLRAGRHGRGQLTLTLVLAGIALALLLGGCGSGTGGGNSSAASSQGSSSVATTWKAQDASSAGGYATLYSVTFADAAHGWAVGQGKASAGSLTYIPIVVATSDGGTAWQAQDGSSAGSNAGLTSVTFVDAMHGWAVGMDEGDVTSPPVIIATTDGGATWEAQDTSGAGVHAWLYSVTFVDATHGWAVGDTPVDGNLTPVILATGDGGATWKAQDASSAGSGARLYSITFADVDHGWAAGAVEESADSGGVTYTPVILATGDGGATWETQDASGADSGAKLASVTFTDAAHGWAAGTNANHDPVILATSDGGATWKAQDGSSAGGNGGLTSITFVNATHGWAVGASTEILATSDGGATWKAQDSGGASDSGLYSVTFADAEHGWAVGQSLGAPVVLAIGK